MSRVSVMQFFRAMVLSVANSLPTVLFGAFWNHKGVTALPLVNEARHHQAWRPETGFGRDVSIRILSSNVGGWTAHGINTVPIPLRT